MSLLLFVDDTVIAAGGREKLQNLVTESGRAFDERKLKMDKCG